MESDVHHRDREHLKLLAIFNFVAAGLAGLSVVWIALSIAFLNSDAWDQAWEDARGRIERPVDWPEERPWPPGPDAEAFEGTFTSLLGVTVVFAMLGVVLTLLNGLYLRRARHRTFSFIVAGLQCLSIPLGTILGVFTIIVLSRASVAELYAEQATGP